MAVAIHASGRRREVGIPRFVHAAVAITAVEAELTSMDGMRKTNGLNGLVADASIFGREIIGHAQRHGPADQDGNDAQKQR